MSTMTSTLKVRPAAEFPHSPTLWAIPDLLPCHHLSAIVAPTGAGLTTLATQLCAQLAPKSEIADRQSEIPSVLLIPGRESPYSLRARLQAAGVAISRVLILENVRDDYADDFRRDSTHRPFNASDHQRLNSILREHKSIRLVLIDNAEDLFIATDRPSRNRFLREFAAFQKVAETREVAITFLAAIPGLRKNPLRTGFLSTLHEVSRAVHLLAPFHDDLLSSIKNQNSKIKNGCLLFPIKNTLHPNAPTLRLAGTDQPVPSDLTYPDYLRLLRAPKKPGPAPDSRNYAIEVLRTILPPGHSLPVGKATNPEPGTIHYLIQEAGLSLATVLRAKEQLGIVAIRNHDHWSWHNPAPDSPLQTETSAPPTETCNSSQKSATSELCPSPADLAPAQPAHALAHPAPAHPAPALPALVQRLEPGEGVAA